VYTIITENDESQWDDDTGALYHFPKKYLKHLQPGTNVIYYKGKLKNKAYSEKRLSKAPHYFALAKIEKVYPDKESTKGDYLATVAGYVPFKNPVIAKTDSGYFEVIPENKKSNYWRDGVRVINKSIYDSITALQPASNVSQSAAISVPDSTNDINYELESGIEGQVKSRYITTYERNPKLRRQAIAIHGCSCKACGFNFGDVYGEYAEGYIHIHHVQPVSELGGPKEVDPESDLVPLCANCHSVVHRKKGSTLSLSQLINMIKHPSNQ